MAESAIPDRIQSFALLRAAQRALARCMHPALLNPVREQGRQLLIQLQSMSEGPSPDALASDEQGAAAEEALAEVDRLLAHQTGMTLEIVGDLDFAQLRAEGRRVCASHPEEVRALIDVMLEGDLSRDKHLRLLEYLITMLSSEEWNGRRTVVNEPCALTPGLRKVARKSIADPAIDCAAAETVLGEAMSTLIRGEDHRALRDEIRSYKRDLGSAILHPRILSCTVSYNVAMWNQVAAQIDSTMAIDQLADDLLADVRDGAGSVVTPEAKGTSVSTPTLGSKAFARLVTAFCHRIRETDCSDAPAAQIVAAFKLDGLRPSEIAALEAEDDEQVNGLVRSAVVLARAIRHQAEVCEPLESLGLEPRLLETECLEELLGEMTAVARKLFADSRYNEAFELSEVKTRNLASLAAGARRRAEGASSEAAVTGGSTQHAGRRRWRLPIGISLPPGVAMIAGPLLALALIALLLSPLEEDAVTSIPTETLSQVSPFLESGHQRIHAGTTHFVGELGPTWEYLPTPERRMAVAEIGEHFSAKGVESVILRGPSAIVLARYQDGEVSELVPRRAER